MTILRDLLSLGYFPKELPPTFDTTSFGDAIAANPNLLTPIKSGTQLCTHRLARARHYPRVLGIPNPLSHWELCQLIETYWTSLQRHMAQSSLSQSAPTDGRAAGRALVPGRGQSEIVELRIRQRATRRYLLRADVTACYASIYTHIIPWALLGKAKAKAQQGQETWENKFDKLVRNERDRQSNGIPVGPDTSLVVSEVVLTAVDQEIVARGHHTGFRFVDDFEFTFASRHEAEDALLAIQTALAKFELELNPTKTEIIELPAPLLDPSWSSTLMRWGFGSDAQAQLSSLVTYFDAAFLAAQSNPTHQVLKYAVARLNDVRVQEQNWRVFQDLLLQCVTVERGAIFDVLPMLFHYQELGYALDLDKIEALLNRHVEHHAPLANASEVAWALWALMAFERPVSTRAAGAVSEMDDAVVALLALDAQSRGLIKCGPSTSQWDSHLDADGLLGDHWLLAYEAHEHQWAGHKAGADYVAANDHFKRLRAHNVRFYHPKKTAPILPKQSTGTAAISPRISLPP